MKKEKSKINIAINGEEKYKSEIVYNNILNTMNEKNMTKEEQAEYFKEKLTLLEASRINLLKQIVITTIGLLVLILGLFMIFKDVVELGIIVSILSFIATIILIVKLTNNTTYQLQSKKYEEIETLRKIIDSRIK